MRVFIQFKSPQNGESKIFDGVLDVKHDLQANQYLLLGQDQKSIIFIPRESVLFVQAVNEDNAVDQKPVETKEGDVDVI